MDQDGIITNRGFLFGDGYFETILLINGAVPLITEHFNRIKKTSGILNLILPGELNDPGSFMDYIKSISSRQGCERLRLNIFREDGGYYLPVSNQAKLNYSITPFDFPNAESGKNTNQVFYSKKIKLAPHLLSNCKTLGRLHQVLLALEAKDRDAADLLVLNQSDHITECISSNIFFIDQSGLHITPNLESGCVAGTMRAFIIRHQHSLGISVVEKPVFPGELDLFVSAYKTNALLGAVPVSAIESITFNTVATGRFSEKLNELITGLN